LVIGFTLQKLAKLLRSLPASFISAQAADLYDHTLHAA
jgi:hypothetical protein